MSSLSPEDLKALLKEAISHLKRGQGQFTFVPTAEQIVLKVIGALNPGFKASTFYKERIVTLENMSTLEIKCKD